MANMFRAVIVVFIFITSISCGGRRAKQAGAEGVGVKPVDIISEVSDTVNLGLIKEGEKVSYRLSLNNNDTVPVVVIDVRTDCGCTTLEYDKKPFRPGESSVISMVYDSRGQTPGKQLKNIYIITSRPGAPIKVMLAAEVR